jgi:hypothetical protein
MKLTDFKIGDTIVQKNDPNIKWIVSMKNEVDNSVYLSRKGGYFNEMVTHFSGENINFEAAGRTELRIKREKKTAAREEQKELFKKGHKTLVTLSEANDIQSFNPDKKVKPQEIAKMAACNVKRVLDAIRDNELPADNTSANSGKGSRYEVRLEDAKQWAEVFKTLNPKSKKENPGNTKEIFLTPNEVMVKTKLTAAIIRPAIKNGELKSTNVNPNGKVPRYICALKDVEKWLVSYQKRGE